MTDMRQVLEFEPDEIERTASIRDARLKWVIVADEGAEGWRRANAIACVAAAFGERVGGLNGPDEHDADGAVHPGLPWIGCSLLAADAAGLVALRQRAAEAHEVLVVGMPAAAQQARSYAEYRSLLGATPTAALQEVAIGLLGPRKAVERLTKKLRLLG
jgi:hypothetical protein